jgi:hypothetical protein
MPKVSLTDVMSDPNVTQMLAECGVPKELVTDLAELLIARSPSKGTLSIQAELRRTVKTLTVKSTALESRKAVQRLVNKLQTHASGSLEELAEEALEGKQNVQSIGERDLWDVMSALGMDVTDEVVEHFESDETGEEEVGGKLHVEKETPVIKAPHVKREGYQSPGR